MDDHGGAGSVSEAYAAARDLLQVAEADAAATREDAERYLRRREQEAELVVGKARRVLSAAEARAAVIVEGARAQALEILAAAESAAGATSSLAEAKAIVDRSAAGDEPVSVIDLVAEEVGATDAADAARKAEGFGPDDSGLDRILASAISNAVHRAFPTDR